MSNYSRIPVKIQNEGVISGIEFQIDTQGLDCILKVHETDLWVYTKPGASSSERYLLKEGETLEFCGKLYYSPLTSGTVYSFMYNRL